MCEGEGLFAVQSVRVRHVLQLGRFNEDGQVDTRFLSPCQGGQSGGRLCRFLSSVSPVRQHFSGNIPSALR